MIFYVGQNLKFIICNSLILLFYVIYVILGLGYLFPYYHVLFNAIYSQIRVLCVS